MDHVGGVALFREPGTRYVAQANNPACQADDARLAQFRARTAMTWFSHLPARIRAFADRYPGVAKGQDAPTPDITFEDRLALRVGELEFELIAAPGGETIDSCVVWLPQHRIALLSNLFGPLFPHFPNFNTLRGENLREPIPMLASLDRAMALAPELLLAGHFGPMKGRDEIQDVLGRTAQGIRHVHDATVSGMNQGKDLFSLMREVKLPPELGLSEQYGRVPWGVRAIYELYTGWFRYESTTELFEVPPRAVYPELAELAGGPEVLASRAQAHLKAGRALEALHLAEVGLAANPQSRPALETQLAALKLLAQEDAGRNFQIAGWLRREIGAVESRLAALR